MKKPMLIIIAALMALALAATVVLAAPGNPAVTGPGGQRGYCQQAQQTPLTDDQKQEMVKMQQQMLEIRKQMLAKQVEWGRMTKEQATERTAWMENRMKTAIENGYVCGGPGGRGPGYGGRSGWGPGTGQQQAAK